MLAVSHTAHPTGPAGAVGKTPWTTPPRFLGGLSMPRRTKSAASERPEPDGRPSTRPERRSRVGGSLLPAVSRRASANEHPCRGEVPVRQRRGPWPGPPSPFKPCFRRPSTAAGTRQLTSQPGSESEPTAPGFGRPWTSTRTRPTDPGQCGGVPRVVRVVRVEAPARLAGAGEDITHRSGGPAPGALGGIKKGNPLITDVCTIPTGQDGFTLMGTVSGNVVTTG